MQQILKCLMSDFSLPLHFRSSFAFDLVAYNNRKTLISIDPFNSPSPSLVRCTNS